MTKDVLIFISVIKKDNQISTWSTIEEIDIDSQADLIDAIAEVIERVKNKKKWIGGKVEKIRVNVTVSAFKKESQLYYKENPTEFNYLLTE
jgi:hypothetical protein